MPQPLVSDLEGHNTSILRKSTGHRMEDKTIIAITVTITCLFLLVFLECASAFCFSPNPLELPLPTTVQQLEAGDTSDGWSPPDANPLSCAQDEGRNTLDLPPPAVTQDGGGKTLVLPPPAMTQDHEGGNTLVLPPPAVMQDKHGYNSGRPNLQSSTLLPMYMDGSDGKLPVKRRKSDNVRQGQRVGALSAERCP